MINAVASSLSSLDAMSRCAANKPFLSSATLKLTMFSKIEPQPAIIITFVIKCISENVTVSST